MKRALLSLFLAAAIFAGATAQAAVVATIGDKAISDDDVRAGYGASLSTEQRNAINKDFDTRRNMVETAVNTEVLTMAAKKTGLDQDDAYRKALDQFQKSYLSNRFVQKNLESRLVKEEIKKFYEDNKSFFDSTQVCAHHIIVQDEAEAKKVMELVKTAMKGVPKAKAQKGKAKEDPASLRFEEVAKKYSIDPSVQETGGNLGCFTRERMVPEFTNAVFNMRKGEVQGPVRTMYGFHIILLNGIKPGQIPGFEEVEQKVKETYRMKLVNEMLVDLRKKSNVKVNQEEIKKLKI